MIEAQSQSDSAFLAVMRYRTRLRWGAVILFIILGAALVTIHIDTDNIRKKLQSEFTNQQLLLAKHAAGEIGRELDDISIEVERLSHSLNTAGSRAEARRSVVSSLDYTDQKGLLGFRLIDQQDQILCTVVKDSSGPVPGIVDSLLSESVTPLTRDETTPASRNMALITRTVAATVSTGFADTVNLLAVIDVGKLVARVAGRIQSGKTGYAWAIDEQARFLYHPRDDFIGWAATEIKRRENPSIDLTSLDSLINAHMLHGEYGTGLYTSAWHGPEEGRIEKLVAYAPINKTLAGETINWSVAVAAPSVEVAHSLTEVRARHISIEIAVIICMLGFGGFAIYYHKYASRTLQERVSRQEGYLSAILQNSIDAIIFIDNENKIKVWNKGAELIFGYTASEMLGSSFRRMIPPDLDPDRELGRIRDEVFAKGHVRDHRTYRQTKDGRRIAVSISRTMIYDKQGNPIGSAAVIKDETEVMELDKHIYNTEKLASIGILAAGVAHEINNPLAIILGFTDLLKERFEKGSQEREDLKVIEENANNAKQIVENLLGFARVTEGMHDIVDVNTALDSVLSIVQSTLKTAKINIETDIAANLPKISGDSREFQQVLFNLINNAVAAMEPTGGQLTVTAYHDHEWVHVEIADTGPGIPERIRERIFDPFFTTKEVGEGTGLGLSLCWGIVQENHGRLTFTSVSREDSPRAASGTAFTVSMPIRRDDGTNKEGSVETENTGN